MASEDVFPARWATRAATDAALALLRGQVLHNGRREAVWRARPDGIVELARARQGRVELLEVAGDGTSRLVAASARSIRVLVADAGLAASFGSLLVGVFGAMAVSERFLPLVGLSLLLAPLSIVLRWRSRVRPWLRGRFGSDRDWVDVPWKLEGEPTTGHQVIALSALAGRSRVRYRVADDGTLEAVVRSRQIEVMTVDRFGETSIVETRPKRGFDIAELRGPEVDWHEVLLRDPSD